MALTFTRDTYELAGNKRRVTGTVTFDSSYATGGEAFNVSDIGLTYLYDLRVAPDGTNATSTNVLSWNKSSSAPTIKAFWSAAAGSSLSEITAATNLSTMTARYEAIGV